MNWIEWLVVSVIYILFLLWDSWRFNKKHKKEIAELKQKHNSEKELLKSEMEGLNYIYLNSKDVVHYSIQPPSENLTYSGYVDYVNESKKELENSIVSSISLFESKAGVSVNSFRITSAPFCSGKTKIIKLNLELYSPFQS